MNFGWRIILIVIVIIAVIAVIFIGLQKSNKTEKQDLTLNQNPTGSPLMETGSLPKATGNIDDAINSLIQDSDKEVENINSDSTDVSAVTYDNSEISNFGQSYENNF